MSTPFSLSAATQPSGPGESLESKDSHPQSENECIDCTHATEDHGYEADNETDNEASGEDVGDDDVALLEAFMEELDEEDGALLEAIIDDWNDREMRLFDTLSGQQLWDDLWDEYLES
jgi:hypothetical protein